MTRLALHFVIAVPGGHRQFKINPRVDARSNDWGLISMVVTEIRIYFIE